MLGQADEDLLLKEFLLFSFFITVLIQEQYGPTTWQSKEETAPGTQSMPTTTSPTERHIVLNAKLFYIEKFVKK